MIKLREFTVVRCGIKFIGSTDFDSQYNTTIHHDPSAYFDLKFIKA